MCARARVCVLTSDRYTVDKRQAISHFSWLPSFRAQKYQTTSHFIHFAMRYINNEREKKEEKKTSSTAKWPGTKKHTKNTHTPHTLYRWLTMSKFGDYSFEMTSEHRHNFGVSRNLEKWASSFCLTIVRTNTHTDILVAAYNLLPVKQWKTQTKLLIQRYEIISNRMGLTCHTTVTLFFIAVHQSIKIATETLDLKIEREKEEKSSPVYHRHHMNVFITMKSHTLKIWTFKHSRLSSW